jgi:hypothetical protein
VRSETDVSRLSWLARKEENRKNVKARSPALKDQTTVAGRRRGSVTTNVVSVALRTVTLPPCATTISRVM